MLVDANADVNSSNLVHIAAENGNEVFVQLLLDAKANVNVLDQLGATPLLLAA